MSIVIKNLWIISSVGINFYSYISPFSDYQLDAALFSGLVAGLSNFAESLSAERKSLDYLKLGDDELYLETVGDVIVATILAGGGENLNAFSVKLMLQFIGQKFVDDYQDKMQELAYEWEEIQKPFTKEIEAFIQDQDLLEDLKIHQFQSLYNAVISRELPADLLHWNGLQLFTNANPNVSKEAIGVVASLEDVTPTLVDDALLEAKILDALHRLTKDLKSSVDQEPRKLLILCDSDDAFKFLHTFLLPSAILSIHCPTITSLQKIISTWMDPNPFDILLIDTRITSRVIRVLHSIPTGGIHTRVLCVADKIPRPPRGRLLHRKQISYVVQKRVEFTRENPLFDYLLSFFTSELENGVGAI